MPAGRRARVADRPGSLAAALDDRDGPGLGVTATEAEAVDPSRPVAHLRIDVPAEVVMPVTVPAALSLPMTAAAAEMVGLAGRILDVAVTHARTREQFGRPIGSFQGIK